MEKKGRLHYLTDGIIKENPVLVLILGTCPTLATTSSVMNGLGMGASTMAVLILSNMVISAIRNIVPDKVRIPCYIVVISGFVTVVQLLMQAYTPALYSSLGLYIPLIVVNCIILGRAEMFANKHNVFDSMLDGIGMGIGFTFTLVIMGAIRELFGSGTLLGFRVMPKSLPGMSIFTLASGGFFVYAIVMAAVNYFTRDKSKIRKDVGDVDLFQEAQDLKKKEA
ncbi:MAG: electron transport complex subunit RsxE [Eubacterium sp.]